jgi:hypothetical protein
MLKKLFRELANCTDIPAYAVVFVFAVYLRTPSVFQSR